MQKFICLSLFLCACILSSCSRETPVERDTPRQILHRNIGPDLANLDPHLATGTNDHSVLSALFEGLVSEDPNDLHPIPGIAERWEISPDNLTYTFYLRKDARWSNGSPLTAEDFVESWKRILTPSLGADNANLLYIIQNAEAYNKGSLKDFSRVGVSAPTPYTLRVHLEHPASYFLSLLQHWAWWPVHLPTIRKHGDPYSRGNAWARPASFVGNGPFNLREWRIGQHIAVEKSSTYWDSDAVTLQGIYFHTIEDVNAEERAFRSGQLHVTDALPIARIRHYRENAPELLRIDPYLGTYFYRINIGKHQLNNPKFRRALALAVDRKGICEKILMGGQQPAEAFTPPGIAGYQPPSVMQTNFDEARRLLKAAGFSEGSPLPEVELLFNSSDNHRIIAEAIQETWRKELGIHARLFNMENKNILSARQLGDYQLLRSTWIADYNDPSSFLSIWTGQSGNNYTGWSNRHYDQYLYQAARTTTPEERNKLFHAAESILLDEAPIIPIYTFTHVYLLHPSVKNWYPNLLDHHPYKYIRLEPSSSGKK